MKKASTPKILLDLLLGLMTLTALGCGIHIGGCSFTQLTYERTEQHTVSMAGITAIDVDTFFGTVTVTGTETDDCRIEAQLTARAPSAEEAKTIAERTKIRIEPADGTVKIFVESPHLKSNHSVGVSFDITMPKSVAAKVHSSYGSVQLSNLQADVKAKTSYASIHCSNVTGDVDLKTSYGSIKCKDIRSDGVKAKTSFSSISCSNVTGPVELKTSYGNISCANLTSNEIEAHSSFGSIDIECSDQTGPQLQADVSTSYGSIEFKTPAGYSGSIEAKTSFGSIKTDLPITVSGKVGKDRISGTVGTGNGTLNLKTSFGSIRIK